MKTKRMMSYVTAAILAASLLAGCGGTSNTGDISSTDQTTTADGEKVTLTALINVGNTMTIEPDDMPSFQNFEKETNVDVQWEVVRTGWEDRKMLVLASGELPDMLFGSRTISSSDIISNKVLFTDLAPYLEQMPNVSKMFEEEPSMKNLVTMEDGSIMYLPSRMPLRPKTLTVSFINQDWLDTLGLEMPTTTDELVTVLEAFRDNDPNGNGQADEIPMTIDFMNTLFGSFGATFNEFASENLMVKDGELSFFPTLEEYKEAIQFMNQLFEAKLIDQEAFTQDGSQSSAKYYSTDPQLVGMGAGWTISSVVGNDNMDSYSPMAPLTGPNGDQMWNSNPIALATTACTWALPDSCSNKEAAIKFIDHIYDPKNSVQLYVGSYGVSLEEKEDGTVQVLESGDPEMTFDNWLWTNGFGDMGPYYVSKSFEEKMIPNSWAKEKLDYDKIYEPYIQDESEIYPPVLYSAEDSTELSVLQTDINNIVNQKKAQWVTGETDIEAEWDSYLESLNNVGLPRAMEIYQKYWDASKNQ